MWPQKVMEQNVGPTSEGSPVVSDHQNLPKAPSTSPSAQEIVTKKSVDSAKPALYKKTKIAGKSQVTLQCSSRRDVLAPSIQKSGVVSVAAGHNPSTSSEDSLPPRSFNDSVGKTKLSALKDIFEAAPSQSSYKASDISFLQGQALSSTFVGGKRSTRNLSPGESPKIRIKIIEGRNHNVVVHDSGEVSPPSGRESTDYDDVCVVFSADQEGSDMGHLTPQVTSTKDVDVTDRDSGLISAPSLDECRQRPATGGTLKKYELKLPVSGRGIQSQFESGLAGPKLHETALHGGVGTGSGNKATAPLEQPVWKHYNRQKSSVDIQPKQFSVSISPVRSISELVSDCPTPSISSPGLKPAVNKLTKPLVPRKPKNVTSMSLYGVAPKDHGRMSAAEDPRQQPRRKSSYKCGLRTKAVPHGAATGGRLKKNELKPPVSGRGIQSELESGLAGPKLRETALHGGVGPGGGHMVTAPLEQPACKHRNCQKSSVEVQIPVSISLVPRIGEPVPDCHTPSSPSPGLKPAVNKLTKPLVARKPTKVTSEVSPVVGDHQNLHKAQSTSLSAQGIVTEKEVDSVKPALSKKPKVAGKPQVTLQCSSPRDVLAPSKPIGIQRSGVVSVVAGHSPSTSSEDSLSLRSFNDSVGKTKLSALKDIFEAAPSQSSYKASDISFPQGQTLSSTFVGGKRSNRNLWPGESPKIRIKIIEGRNHNVVVHDSGEVSPPSGRVSGDYDDVCFYDDVCVDDDVCAYHDVCAVISVDQNGSDMDHLTPQVTSTKDVDVTDRDSGLSSAPSLDECRQRPATGGTLKKYEFKLLVSGRGIQPELESGLAGPKLRETALHGGVGAGGGNKDTAPLEQPAWKHNNRQKSSVEVELKKIPVSISPVRSISESIPYQVTQCSSLLEVLAPCKPFGIRQSGVVSVTAGDSSSTKIENSLSLRSFNDSNFSTGVKKLWCEMPEVREKNIPATMTMDEMEFQEALFEIITSEASYLKSLDLLISHFMQAETFKPEVVSKNNKQVLFSNITSVRRISDQFMTELEAVWQAGCVLSPAMTNVIAKFATGPFQVYVTYCSNQVYQERRLKHLKYTQPAFREALYNLERSSLCHSLPMQSFLALPMQRITGLSELVIAIRHHMWSNDPEYDTVVNALQALQKLERQCNEGARQMENLEKIAEIDKWLDFKNIKRMPLVSAGRYLVKKGQLTHILKEAGGLIIKKKKEHLYLFLLNDLLLVTKKKSEDQYQVVDYASRINCHAEAMDEADLSRSLPHGVPASCRNVFIMALLENHDKKHTDFYFACDSPSERMRWVDAVTAAQQINDDERIYEAWACPQVQAIFRYVATEPYELSLEESDIVNVLRKMANGWYEGERIRDGERGWFPANHTVEIQSERVRARNLLQRYRLLTLNPHGIQQNVSTV